MMHQIKENVLVSVISFEVRVLVVPNQKQLLDVDPNNGNHSLFKVSC